MKEHFSTRLACAATAATAVLLAFSASPLQAMSITPLGDPPGGGIYRIPGAAISSGGGAVVGTRVGVGGGATGRQAFRWTIETGMTGLGDLPGGIINSAALDISGDGKVAVGVSSSSNGNEAFIWTSGSGMQSLGDLPGGFFRSHAAGVSSDGSVVVGVSHSTHGREAFRWTSSGGMQSLGDLPGGTFLSSATDISADGIVVGTSDGAYGREAFRWTSIGGMEGLGDLPGGSFTSGATSVSDDGSTIIGGSSGIDGYEAFRWTENDGMEGLGFLPGGFESVALGVSVNGSSIVGYSYGGAASPAAAFLWTESLGMLALSDVLADAGVDLSYWSRLEMALDISENGQFIVGSGVNSSGYTEAFLVDLGQASSTTVPEGGNITLLFAAVCVCVCAVKSSRDSRENVLKLLKRIRSGDERNYGDGNLIWQSIERRGHSYSSSVSHMTLLP